MNVKEDGITNTYFFDLDGNVISAANTSSAITDTYVVTRNAIYDHEMKLIYNFMESNYYFADPSTNTVYLVKYNFETGAKEIYTFDHATKAPKLLADGVKTTFTTMGEGYYVLYDVENNDYSLISAENGTVILKALEGDYKMEIVAQDNEAKTNLANSLLRGNFVSQMLTQSEDVKKFIFTKPLNSPVGFYRMQDEGGQIGANKCWMEWNVQTMPTNAKAFQITFEQTTDIEGVSTAKPSAPVIYDLAGRRLKAPQRGFNIVNGKKVIVK
jgi:hypothetical protein